MARSHAGLWIAAAVVVALFGVMIFAPASPELLAGSPEPTPAAKWAGNVFFWITLDLALSTGFLVWALVFRRSWRILPFVLYWILVIFIGVSSYGLLESKSWAALIPIFGAMYLGAPWNFLLLHVPLLDSLIRAANDLPGNGIVLFWIGILINQVLLALLVLKKQANLNR